MAVCRCSHKTSAHIECGLWSHQHTMYLYMYMCTTLSPLQDIYHHEECGHACPRYHNSGWETTWTLYYHHKNWKWYSKWNNKWIFQLVSVCRRYSMKQRVLLCHFFRIYITMKNVVMPVPCTIIQCSGREATWTLYYHHKNWKWYNKWNSKWIFQLLSVCRRCMYNIWNNQLSRYNELTLATKISTTVIQELSLSFLCRHMLTQQLQVHCKSCWNDHERHRNLQRCKQKMPW